MKQTKGVEQGGPRTEEETHWLIQFEGRWFNLIQTPRPQSVAMVASHATLWCWMAPALQRRCYSNLSDGLIMWPKSYREEQSRLLCFGLALFRSNVTKVESENLKARLNFFPLVHKWCDRANS